MDRFGPLLAQTYCGMCNRWFRVGALAVSLSAVACSVSPVPEPPREPELGATEIEIESCPSCDGFVILRGGAGATKWASRVWGVNLDLPDPPVEAEVNPDGSFALRIRSLFRNEIRLQARSDASRSVPRDFQVDVQGSPNMFPGATRPFGECFRAPLELDLDAPLGGPSAVATLSASSTCAVDLEIASVALRTPHPAFSVEQLNPSTLASGGSLEVRVVFTPSDTSTAEEILLIEVAGPQRDRRAITLFGRGRP